MSKNDVALVFISGFEAFGRDNDGKLAPWLDAERAEFGALLGREFGNVSEANVVNGTGGIGEDKVDGNTEVEVGLVELVLEAESRGEETSGRFEGPLDKEELKFGYCICCCMKEGIESPGGGRSKGCCDK